MKTQRFLIYLLSDSLGCQLQENNMKLTLVAVVILISVCGAANAQQGQTAKTAHVAGAPPIEANVHKLWEAFKNKDKTTLSNLLDDNFRMFEEGLETFADKKAEVNAVDDYDLLSYTLSDFTVKSTAPNTAVVTYIVQYEGKSGGQVAKAKSVFGEVWIRSGNGWKDLYLQETYVK
jgi:hypothetical protein